jgi:hypothetical protein
MIMKKIMMIAAMMVATLIANAQNQVGQLSIKPTIGLNFATMTKAVDSKVRTGLNIGLEAEYGVSEKFGVTAGLFYSQQGVKSDADWGFFLIEDTKLIGATQFEGKTTVKLDFINIPIMAQYYIVPGLAIKAGIQPGFNVLKKVYLDGVTYNASIQGGAIEKVDDSFKIDEGVKGFQFAIPVGLSYEYANFVLDARYNIGVTKAIQDVSSHHSVFSISLGYKITIN